MTFEKYIKSMKRAPKEYWPLLMTGIHFRVLTEDSFIMAAPGLPTYQFLHGKWNRLKQKSAADIDGHLPKQTVEEFLKETVQ